MSMTYEEELEERLEDLTLARRALSISDARRRAMLTAMAHAEGHEDLWVWAEDIVRAGRSVGEWIEDYVLPEWDDVEVAQRIVVYASPDDSSPWGEDWSEDPASWTIDRFRSDVLEWSLSGDDPNITDKDRADTIALGEAALRHDGREARRLGMEIRARWDAAVDGVSKEGKKRG